MTLPLIQVLIVEDQPNIRDDLYSLVERCNGFTVAGACGTVMEARQFIAKSKPDLLLLDIQLPDGTGFDILKDFTNEFKTIFLTAYNQHAIQAIKYGALDYLLKPIDEIELFDALDKVTRFYPAKAEQLSVAHRFHNDAIAGRLVLRSQEYLQVVEIDQILYAKSDAGYTVFYLNDGRNILVSKILKDYEDLLMEPLFLRPHQSYLVNTNYIDRYRKDGTIVLKNGAEIPVATRRKELVMNFFNRLS